MAGHPFEQVLAALGRREGDDRLLAVERAGAGDRGGPLRVALDTTSATVASLEDLVAMKRAAGRPLDLADVAALEAITAKGGGRS